MVSVPRGVILKTVPDAVGPARVGCPVEVPVGGLHQPGDRVFAVSAAGLGAKAVKRGQLALRR